MNSSSSDDIHLATMELIQMCRSDERIDLDQPAKSRRRIVKEHVNDVAKRYGLKPTDLAKSVADRLGSTMASADRKDFERTKQRMGYRYTCLAASRLVDGSLVEIAVVRADEQSERWSVIKHVDCDPDRPTAGFSERNDYDTFNDARASYQEMLSRLGPSSRLAT